MDQVYKQCCDNYSRSGICDDRDNKNNMLFVTNFMLSNFLPLQILLLAFFIALGLCFINFYDK